MSSGLSHDECIVGHIIALFGSICKESTLRDRTRGLVALDARNGSGILITHAEEEKLVGHIKDMTDTGNKSVVQFMAKYYAQSHLKDVKPSFDFLSTCCFYGFMGRRPDLKIVKS